MLRSLGRCCLSGEGGSASARLSGGSASGGAAEMLPCPLPLLKTHPPSLLAVACCCWVSAEIGATSTASGRLEVNLFLSEKRGGKSHFGIILVSALCHDESWYQLKHGLHTWAKVCLTSPPSPREKDATAQARHRGDGQVWGSEFVSRRSKLVKFIPFLTCHHSSHWYQCIPESRLIQTPQDCVRLNFNFRHWLILFHQPIAISQSLGL